jgi:hypothetical protein
MKYAIEMASGIMMYIPTSVIQKLIRKRIARQHGQRISLLFFFQNKEVG